MTTAKPTILVVEDEAKVAQFIKKGLDTQAFIITVAPDGREGKRLLGTEQYDLAILDVNLPYISGIELAQYIRRKDTYLPILMLTALDTTADKLTGFEAGADDYLAKPFDFLELLARVRALLRRNAPPDESERLLTLADLELDCHQKVARRAGKTILLTAREYDLLHYLLRNQGRVVSRVDIAEQVWDIGFDTGTNTIDVYISYLRNKIDRGMSPKLIHTVIGMGYVIREM